MATLRDVIKPDTKLLLETMQRQEEELRMAKLKEFYDEFGLHSYDEMLEYIKSNGHIGHYGNEYLWEPEKNAEKPIRHYYQTGDDDDSDFWMTSERISEQEFLDYYHNLEAKYGDSCYNEFGCLVWWEKDSKIY